MTTSADVELRLDGHDATEDLGRRLGRALPPASAGVLLLSGHLGAGKTTLVKGLAVGLGVAEAIDVTSPTFLRLVRYDGAPDLVHVDAYRMAGVDDVHDLGLDEDLAGGALVAIEWPEMIADALPADVLVVELVHAGEDHRIARVSARGPASAEWLQRVRSEGGA